VIIREKSPERESEMGHSDHQHDHAPEMRFCPRCGGRLGRRREKPSRPEHFWCRDCGFVVFADPKVSACAIPRLNGRIVLLRRAIEPAYGKWVFPGGFVDRGERVEDAAIRETKEEANLDVRLHRLLNVYSYTDYPVVVIVYVADVIGGELRAQDETLEASTFWPREIPWEHLAFPSTKDALSDYVSHYVVRAGT
jgi:ADP-ribose pyrophosphatase YjhB (NUDIX family)